MKKNDLPNHTIDSVIETLFCCEEKILKTPPKVLILYGSIREGSYSQSLAKESAEILKHFGCECTIYDPESLPLANIGLTQTRELSTLPEKVIELRQLTTWCEAMVWICPEVHGSMSSVFKNQIDWLPLVMDSVRPTQGKLLALMQIEGGSQSFNVLNQMRVLGRWMRMFTIPNQSSIPQAYQYFSKDEKLLPSRYRERVVDVLEELFKFILLLRGNMSYLVQRYSEDIPDNDDIKNQPKEVLSFQGTFESFKIARESGISATQLKEKGASLPDLVEAGFLDNELMEAGFDGSEILKSRES